MEVGEREMEIIYLSLHCHHQNDFCIKVGNGAMRLRAILMSMTTTFEVKGEPK